MSAPMVDVRAVEGRRARHGFSASRPPAVRPHCFAEAAPASGEQPSLDAPPVYRRFLAGGSRPLHPDRPALTALLLAGATMFGIAWQWLAPNVAASPLVFATNAAGALVCCAVLVLSSSRWLGGRLGLLAGLVWLSSIALFGGQVNTWLAATCCLAMGLFAAAEVPGRLPMATHRAVGWAFHAAVGLSLVLFGLDAAVAVLTACAVYLVIGQNTRAVRFLFDPVGLGILATAIVGRAMAGQLVTTACESAVLDGSLTTCEWTLRAAAARTLSALVATGTLPWAPLALVAVAVGLRQGHYATPFWRLLGCWMLAGIGLAAAGTTSDAVAAAVAAPPGCALAAAGLAVITSRTGLTRRCTGLWRRTRP